MTQLITREFSSKLDNGVSLEGIAFASTSLYDTRFDLIVSHIANRFPEVYCSANDTL